KVLYVDKYMREKIVKRNPSLKDKELVKVDIMDDAEKLEKFNNNSLDFVIAN
ncbi:MAG: methyltransferase type 11, partial [Candidatus Aenigmarchaeota archaeon]|nr:methyltransferase type 11 [Candidatus Aenigmarchaeota archaeon]